MLKVVKYIECMLNGKTDGDTDTHDIGREGEEGPVLASAEPAVQQVRRVRRPDRQAPPGLLTHHLLLGLCRHLGAAVGGKQEVTVGDLLEQSTVRT